MLSASWRCRPDSLEAIVRASPWYMRALREARALELASWCIGAGAIRNLVWDHLHGRRQPSQLADIDLAYFDAEESPGVERAHQALLEARCRELPWEVTNQAHVHLWFERHFGHAVPPLRSLVDAVSSWPETATSVGIALHADDALEIIAPFGLNDLFAMQLRRNPARVSVKTYLARVASKRYETRWPLATIHKP